MLLELILGCSPREPLVDSATRDPCPSLAGLELDRGQDWRVHADSEDLASGAWTRGVVAGAEPEEVRVGQLETREGKHVEFEDTRRYRCDAEGLWWTEQELRLSIEDGGEVTEGLQRTVWEEPPLLLAAGEIETGDRWEGIERWVFSVDGEEDAPHERSYFVEIGARLLVTTPAGTFEVYEWRKGDRVEFLSPGLGPVRDDDGELL